MKKVILIFFSLFFATLSFAQKNFISGVIFTQNGEVKGLIDYREWKINPDNIVFRKDLHSETITYSPEQIKGFKVSDEWYVSAEVAVENSPSILSELNNDSEYNFSTEIVFLRTLIEGPVSLYQYQLQNGKDLFYFKKDTSFEFLRYKKYKKEVSGETIVSERTDFRGQLVLLFNDCAPLSAKFQKLQYKKRAIEKLFLSYYECADLSVTFNKKPEKVKLGFGAVAGVAMTTLNFSGESENEIENFVFPQSVKPIGGLFLEVILPRNRKKWSFYNELLFTTYSASTNYRWIKTDYFYKDFNATISNSYLKINNMIRYNYPVSNVRVFANVGFSNGFAVQSVNELKFERYLFGEITPLEEKVVSKRTSYEQGLLFGLGLKYQHFSLECRYENGNGMSALSYLSSSTQTLALLIGYKF